MNIFGSPSSSPTFFPSFPILKERERKTRAAFSSSLFSLNLWSPSSDALMAKQELAAAAAAVLSAGRTNAFTRPSAAATTTATAAPSSGNAPSSSAAAAAAAPAALAPLEIALFAQLAQLAGPHGNASGMAAAMQQQQGAATMPPPPVLYEQHRHPAASAPAAPLTAGGGAGAAGAACGTGRTRSGESRMSTTYASRHQLAEQRRRNRINER